MESGVDPVDFFRNVCDFQYQNYKAIVSAGGAKEQARMLLPQNIYSECIWTCSLQTILFFLHQRLKEDAQWEIREYAKAIKNLVQPILIDDIIKWYNRRCSLMIEADNVYYVYKLIDGRNGLLFYIGIGN